jgi:GNAT superfamily N-acetyltransferase
MARTVSDIRIRFATADDAGLLLQLIRQLAAYERAPNAVTATEEDLRRYGFGPERQFEALLAFLDGEPAGLALFHPRFSTWLGRPGVYLEDLFVARAARGKGVGRRLMTRLAAIAVERGWERIDFQVA